MGGFDLRGLMSYLLSKLLKSFSVIVFMSILNNLLPCFIHVSRSYLVDAKIKLVHRYARPSPVVWPIVLGLLSIFVYIL